MAVFQKIAKSDQHADCDRKCCTPGRAQSTESQHCYQYIVKDNIQNQSRQGHDHSHIRLSVGSYEVLKKQFEGHGNTSQKDDICIGKYML